MTREVVVLSRSLPMHGIGGMEIAAWDLSREIARQGHPVRVITTAMDDGRGEFEQDGVRVVPLPGVPARRYSSAWWKASRAYFERQCLGSTAAVLSVSAGAYGLLPLKPQVPGVPFILQAHGTSWGELISKWRSGRIPALVRSLYNLLWLPRDLLAYRRFDAIVAVGDRVYRDLTKQPVGSVLQPGRVHLINNGIDTTVFRPDVAARDEMREQLGVDGRTPIVISASRLHVQKGVNQGIYAFKYLLQQMPDALYLIAGDGPERQRLQALAAELGLAQRVRFIGAIERTRLANWLRAADVFLFLTEHVEGLPLNVLEALACGLPALISDHLRLFTSPAIRLVPPRDHLEVARKLREILAQRRHLTSSELPDSFHLHYSARKYVDLLTSERAAGRSGGTKG